MRSATRKRAATKPATMLSFDMDDEGESFAVKKSKPRSNHAAPMPRLAEEGLSTLGLAGGRYTAEHLQQLRDSMQFKAVQTGTSSAGGTPLEDCEIPDAEDVSKARAERERARRLAKGQGGRSLAGPQGTELISGGTPSERSESTPGAFSENRLVREEQECDDEEPSVFDDHKGASLAFCGSAMDAAAARKIFPAPEAGPPPHTPF